MKKYRQRMRHGIENMYQICKDLVFFIPGKGENGNSYRKWMPVFPFGYILRDRNCTRVQLQRINTYYALALRSLNKQHFLYKQTRVQIQRHVWDELPRRFSKGYFSKTPWYIGILFGFRSRIVWSWQRSYLDKTQSVTNTETVSDVWYAK